MKKALLMAIIALASSASFAGNARTVGEHVRFAIQNQVSTFKLERWLDSNNTVGLSTCVAVGEFKQETDKIYELAQVAYLTGEMSENVRAKADDLSKIAMSLLPFCGVNQGLMPKESYSQIVEKAKLAIVALQESVK